MAPELSLDIEKRFANGVAIAAQFGSTIGRGRILVLFGPSGAGKTTVVRCVAGLDRPDAGVIRFGTDCWIDVAGRHFTPVQDRRVGYVFQEAALFPHLTVRRNVEFGMRARDAAAGVLQITSLLTTLGVAALGDHYPRQLSGGQQQRVALARALAADPRLLLLDEPFSSLDQPARAAMRRLLREVLSQKGIGALLVTHDRNEAIALGDEMAVLAEGRVRQIGRVADVFRRPADLAVARAVGVDSVLEARVDGEQNGLVELQVGEARLRAVSADLGDRLTRQVFACIRAEDVTLERSASPGASARNHLPGRVVAVESEGALERVTIDCGFLLTALITRHARDEMALAPGGQVVAAVKATAIHLVARA
jgi:molybdate transport system ATP-binding protein